MQIRGTNRTFIRISRDDVGDGALYMMDYDELNIEHGELSIDISNSTANGIHTRESKS